MNQSHHVVYIAEDNGRIYVGSSHNPALDAVYFTRQGIPFLWCISQPLPAYLAEWVKEETALFLKKGGERPSSAKFFRALLRSFGQHPQVAAALVPPRLVSADAFYRVPCNLGVPPVLEGRLLRYGEVLGWKERTGGFAPLAFRDHLHLLALAGKILMFPAITAGPEGWRCHRCGNKTAIDLIPCERCQGVCPACADCRSLGLLRGCEWLYAFPSLHRLIPRSGPLLQLSYELSPPQQAAAEQVLKLVNDPSQSCCLVWAVCGAGKTEVVYPAMEAVLMRGGRVLFAVPRRDVVVELRERIAKAFPQVPVVGLYGGTPERYGKGSVTVATTHQVLRFYRAFDLVILDELDAFPFRGSPMLKMALERARKPEGKLVYMSATPTEELIRRGQRGEVHLAFISARHHGFPVPEPKIVLRRWCHWGESRRQREALIRALDQEILRTFRWRRLLLFVPYVAMAQPLMELLKTRGWPVDYCYAADPLRQEKIRRFREADPMILVATSLLERGVTIPQVDVVILFAHEARIYDASTLIQMSGRVGRTAQWPTGRCLMVAKEKTPAMVRAVGIIRQFNDQAQKQRYFSPEGEKYLIQMRKGKGDNYSSL